MGRVSSVLAAVPYLSLLKPLCSSGVSVQVSGGASHCIVSICLVCKTFVIINTNQPTAVICAHAYTFNTVLLSYFGTGHVTAMARALGTLLITPAGCHLRAVIFRGNSGFRGLNSKDAFWFEWQDSIGHRRAVTWICLGSPFPLCALPLRFP